MKIKKRKIKRIFKNSEYRTSWKKGEYLEIKDLKEEKIEDNFTIFDNFIVQKVHTNNSYSKVKRDEIVKSIKENFYKDKSFYTEKQSEEGYIKEWTNKQLNFIFKSIKSKFFTSETTINKQAKERIIKLIKAIPLILDDSPDHPYKTDIAKKSGYNVSSGGLYELIQLLRPIDFEEHFSWKGQRNPAKRLEVRQKISKKRKEKVKINDIRKAVANYIFSILSENWTYEINLNNILENISKNEYLKPIEDVKISSYIIEQIEIVINVTKLILEPLFTDNNGLNQLEIRSLTESNTAVIKELSKNFKKEFSKLYSHNERFERGGYREPSKKQLGRGYRISPHGDFIKHLDIRNRVCNYLFSELSNDWNKKLDLNEILKNINSNQYLLKLREVKITNYLKKQFKKYLIAVPFIMEPYFIKNSESKIKTIEDIHQESGLANQTIRKISQNFEISFGKVIYNDLERFPVPQWQIKEIIKGYPREFYDSELRLKIQLSQTVIIIGDRLYQSDKGIFRDLLTGEPINKEDSIDLHHLNYNKFDNREKNLCFLKSIHHNKISANQFNKKIARYFKKLLKHNKYMLKKGKIPETWKDKSKSYLDFVDENQLDLSRWL